MTERDIFELRFATAVQLYAGRLASDLDPVELAHRIAAREPRRHGLSAALARRGLTLPARLWVLLVLAALVFGLVAGTLLAGSRPVVLPAVLPPIGLLGTCPAGSNPDKPGPAEQARPPEAGPLAFDRAAGKIVMLSGAGTWTFDVCSNTWTLMQWGSGRPTGLALVYDPGADRIIGVDYPEHPVADPPHAWAYSLADNTWTRKGPAPDYVARLWYDAASGQVAAWATESDEVPGTIWTYGVAADAWAQVGALEVLGGYGWNTPGDLLAYDANLERVVATVVGDRERTRLLDMRTGIVDDVRAAAPWASQCGFFVSMYCYGEIAGAAIAYDERAERTVVRVGANLFAYDAAADRWDTLYESGAAPSGLARESWSMAFDPVNGRLVVPGGAQGTVLAFDATTREWTVLLEPSKAQPAPTP